MQIFTDSEPSSRREGASLFPASGSVIDRTLVEDIEKGGSEQDEAVPDDQERIEYRLDDSPSNRALLIAGRAAIESASSDEPRSNSPALPSPILPVPQTPPGQIPPPSYRMQNRQSTDDGVRLEGGGLSLRRVNTESSAASMDSLTTLPPPYESSC
ncbi:hypothetical protein EIP86_005354 [Pleurotus ostreatoroseus]|nr:hypothetical protein EIP86_005354 [Pleurotus ostreatoroseus]